MYKFYIAIGLGLVLLIAPIFLVGCSETPVGTHIENQGDGNTYNLNDQDINTSGGDNCGDNNGVPTGTSPAGDGDLCSTSCTPVEDESCFRNGGTRDCVECSSCSEVN